MNRKINYAIVSYHRPQCITVRALLDLGINKDDITIFIQDKDDVDSYDESWSGIRKIFRESRGLNANRNNALRSYQNGDWVLLFDDDCTSFAHLVPISKEKISTRKITDGNLFINLMRDTFVECERISCPMWGVSPTSNALFAKSRLLGDGIYSVNRLFQGGVIGHIKNDIYYDESYDLMTDYELQLRYYSFGDILLRRNDFAANKKPNGNYQGGLYDTYRVPDLRKRDMERVAKKYSDFVSIKPDWSGLKQKI